MRWSGREVGSGFLTEYVGEPAYGVAARSNARLSFKYRRIWLIHGSILYYTTMIFQTNVLYRLSRTKRTHVRNFDPPLDLLAGRINYQIIYMNCDTILYNYEFIVK